jgi:hypothetical protein
MLTNAEFDIEGEVRALPDQPLNQVNEPGNPAGNDRQQQNDGGSEHQLELTISILIGG